ncbi:prolyl hydroxylase family protein [Neptuniibacter caesariensis]|uniref:Fe2OG dioxygenase domain-containing protein n=1 Tax=Neptuniibacter caesariensis TaxID=207954 RepID=A0A7U8GSF1_NEPCE|nr:2OG-Fe(II) oxygenase [Neptuniibacter caesariensis]EAR62427.1 hypothetical protein MED92_15358 [Oceanospirillum sp. MED92] [Neptuniibacter caesariensis]
MSHTKLPKDWLDWVEINIQRDCDRSGMIEILVEHGFSYEAASEAVFCSEATSPPPPLFIPCAEKIDTHKAEVFYVNNFLSPEECAQMIELIQHHQRPSTTTNETGHYKHYRTSKTCDLSLLESTFVAEIDQRICKMLGIEPSYSEGIQGQWYDIGEEFKPHTDYFEPKSDEFLEHAEARGQRTWTFMIYLNNTQEGGGTFFPELGQRFLPSQGKAVIWNNLTTDGSPNPATLHHGEPVKRGYKAIITKWFRSKGTADSAQNREANENFPCHSQTGFLKSVIPEALFRKLLVFHHSNQNSAITESVPGFIHSKEGEASSLITLSDDMKEEIHATLKPIAEAWSGCLLKPTFVYGIREYHQGAVLEMHRDRLNTHEVSLILNIQQKTQEDWPLTIEDHFYRQHQITMQPGQMLLYEGCRLLHGRPTPLKGSIFANIFVHYSVE